MDKITEEKRQEYISLRDDFHKKRDNLNPLINKYKKIKEHSQQIKNLEKELKDSRPLIKGCDNFISCEICDIYSMKYIGNEPGERLSWYKCVICGHREYSN